MNDSATMARLLDAIRTHLSTHRLPVEIASVAVASTLLDGEHVTVHLRRVALPVLAAALLEWADTLTHVTVTVWRPSDGRTVHLILTGQLADGTVTEVYSGVDHTDALFGDLQPGGRHTVALSILRRWAADGSAVAA